ncbi:MAG: Uma2 family endonuclease [Nostocales cyanobacterium 94392]|nr:Uma2 family endonuclease [Nostocales cyanobacterium 94392]
MTIYVKKNVNTIPLLESGDRLTVNEFERRYTAMPDNIKAELIEGIVYMASPLRIRSHGEPHANLIGWLWTYKIATQGLILGDNSTVRLDLDNEPQPDVVLFIDENLGGQARISEDDYIEGSPELVAEVAASSASYDLYDKKNAFRRNGVLEYIVWQVFENKLDWFCLQDGKYISLEADGEGIIKSRVFPGLWLATSALLTGDMKQVLYVLQQGLNSSEHAEFVKQLTVDS